MLATIVFKTIFDGSAGKLHGGGPRRGGHVRVSIFFVDQFGLQAKHTAYGQEDSVPSSLENKK